MSTSRRAHTKSRAGCLQCKARRVKCDESVPCSSCVRRAEQCSLLQPSPSSPSTPLQSASTLLGEPIPSPSPSSLPQPTSLDAENGFSLQDFALYHHYLTVTAQAYAKDHPQKPWLTIVPEIAVRNLHSLYALLAVAALDLSKSESEPRSSAYLRVAGQHHSRSLSLFRIALAALSPDTLGSVFVTSTLYIRYYFGSAADAASLLFNDADAGLGPPAWILPIRGCAALYVSNQNAILSGPLSGFISPFIIPQPPDFASRPYRSKPALINLQACLSVPLEDAALYADVFDELKLCFSISETAETQGRLVGPLHFVSVVPVAFFDRLAARAQPALAIMVIWCVLLHRQGDGWFGSQRAREMQACLLELLHPEARSLVGWAVQETNAPR